MFQKAIRLVAFRPFASAEAALDNVLQLSEGQVTPMLRDFLVSSVKAVGGEECVLGIAEERLAVSISENTGLKCEKNARVTEILRGIRTHFDKYVKELSADDWHKSQLGLGHSYSRSKVKFNVNRVDNMIIQSIALLDQIDKDLNTFAMRCREWYSWHFPELYAIVQDNITFARLVTVIQDKAKLSAAHIPRVQEVVGGDLQLAEAIMTAAKTSMGMEISEIDLGSVVQFAERVASLAAYRLKLHQYLRDKMKQVAPNLAALIGEMVGARLIAHAGSLTALAKYPASTVQILGAEKALFRALKQRQNTPKYGHIFHSSFIGKASSKNKGRISRYLANKCSIASRLDCFSDVPTEKFGLVLREQVEERLAYYEGGGVPRKNVDVMKEVIDEVKRDLSNQGVEIPVNESGKRAAKDDLADDDDDDSSSSEKKAKKEKKKKEKKDKKKSKKDKKKEKK